MLLIDTRTLERRPLRLPAGAELVVLHTGVTRELAALRGTAAGFGSLMNASHASLRDDFEVSTPELDALVRSGCAGEVARRALAAYAAAGFTGHRVA